ncbi:unnamed protein product, partial [Mesorhabditis spiculigera]
MPTENIYERPYLFILFLRVNVCLSTPVNVFTLYMIAAKSTKGMKEYRWCIGLLQLTTSVFELLLEAAGPEIFLPFFGLTMHGFGSAFFSIYPDIAFLGTLWVSATFGLGIVLCFLYRYEQLRLDTQGLKAFLRIVALAVIISVIWTIIALIVWQDIYIVRNDPAQVAELARRFPYMDSYLKTMPDTFYIEKRLDYDFKIFKVGAIRTFFILMGIFVIVVVFTVGYFSYKTTAMLNGHQINLSQATRKLQRKFFRALVVQVAVPLLTWIIPLFFLGYVVLRGTWQGQEVMNISISIMATHGLTSSISVLVMIKEPEPTQAVGSGVSLTSMNTIRPA